MANYILVDYENVQPKNLHSDLQEPFNVLLFLGEQQTKIPLTLATAMQNLGNRAQYIKLQSGGNNALDFHIAFYLGKLVGKAPQAKFYIISKDKGYESLIQHLQACGINVVRRPGLTNINSPASNADKFAADSAVGRIMALLATMPNNKPGKIATLHNTVNARLKTTYKEQKFAKILNKMQQANLLKLDGDKIIYNI